MTDLRGFIKDLDQQGELIRIKDELSPNMEISAGLQRFDAGKAVLFEKVSGHNNSVVGGVCGTRDRILHGLGVSNEGLYGRLLQALKTPIKCEVVEDGSVMEVIEEGDSEKDSDINALYR